MSTVTIFFVDGHFISELMLFWKGNDSVKIDKSIRLPEHVIADIQQGNSSKNYGTGTYYPIRDIKSLLAVRSIACP